MVFLSVCDLNVCDLLLMSVSPVDVCYPNGMRTGRASEILEPYPSANSRGVPGCYLELV